MIVISSVARNLRGSEKPPLRFLVRPPLAVVLEMTQVYFFLTLFFSPFVFADSSQKIFSTVSPDKPLSSSPQFVVFEDFNSGRFEKRQNVAWQIKAPAQGGLDLALDKTDSRNAQRGYSLKASFNLLPQEQAFFESFLNRIDASHADDFVFNVRLNPRGQNPFDLKLRVTLSDWQHHAAYQEVALSSKDANQWREVSIPITSFKALDLDQLFKIKFSLISTSEKAAGDLWVDEIAFYGKGDLAFESHRDNLVGFPGIVFDEKRNAELLKQKNDKKLLLEIARDTWKYFENARDKDTQLVVDHIRLGDAPLAADYTSPTNIAVDLMGTIAAMDLGFIDHQTAQKKTDHIIATLQKLKRYKKLFYNFYDTKKLKVTRDYISSVDCGWLAIALVVVRQAFDGATAENATEILNAMSFEEFLDPENNQLVVGLDVPERNFGNYHYGLLASEARATSFYAIGKGDLPREHWWFIYRTLPDVWKWQNQVPQGKNVNREGQEYFQGYYEYKGKKFVPSWGGSLFEFLMPTLVLKEKELAPKGFGMNDRVATEIQIDYALNEKKYPVWGLSPAATSNGRKWKYNEYGVKTLSAKGYPDQGVITPHVSFLALDPLPKEAIKNIRAFLKLKSYGPYGFFDSWDAKHKIANPQYLALDQGMILVAICNYLKKGSIQNRFHHDEVAKNAESLLKEEAFFA